MKSILFIVLIISSMIFFYTSGDRNQELSEIHDTQFYVCCENFLDLEFSGKISRIHKKYASGNLANVDVRFSNAINIDLCNYFLKRKDKQTINFKLLSGINSKVEVGKRVFKEGGTSVVKMIQNANDTIIIYSLRSWDGNYCKYR